ncbi:DUF5011 domain-containing protein [Patescibacteria group bacterium]|nr:DUF5011 domain-containing protein [Patescibacteria group bacterium]
MKFDLFSFKKLSKITREIFILVLVFLISLSPFFSVDVYAVSGVATILPYQGRLTNSSGDLVGGAGTSYYFKFSIWNDSTVGGGSKLWPASSPSSFSSVVRQGVFNVNIGDTSNGYPDALNYNFNTNKDIYLQVEVSSDNSTFETLSPRQRISSSAFAQLASQVSGTGASSFGTTTSVSNAVVTIEATSTNSVPLLIRSASGQTSNIFHVQDSLLNNLFSIGSLGGIFASSTLQVTGNTTLYGSLDVTGSATSTLTGGLNLSKGLQLNSGYIYGAGLTSCSGSSDKLIWNSATGKFGCGTDAGAAGSGITSIGAQYSSVQTGATQTFATSTDTNLGLTITSAGDTHTFTPTWLGLLSVARGGTGATDAATARTNLGVVNYSDTLVQAFIHASTTIPKTYTANTFTGANTFSQIITGAISGNAGTVTNGVYTNTFNSLFDPRFVTNLSATSSVSGISSLPNLSIVNSQISDFTSGVTSLINASTTIPKTYTANTFTGLQTFTNSSTTLGSFTYASATTANIGTLSLNGSDLQTTLNSKSSFAWPFSVSTNYVSTSTTVGFLNGLFSTASSTFSSNLYLSNLATGGAAIGANGIVYSAATTTAGTGLTYSGNAFNLNLNNANTWSALQTFTNSSTTLGSFTYASTTNLVVNGQSFNNLLGSGLLNTSNALTLDTTFLNNTTNAYINASTTIPKTYTANVFSALQTFNYSSTTYGSFVTASTTNFNIGGSAFTSLLGSGLSNSGGALTVSNVPLTSLATLAANSVVTTNSSGALIATGTQLTVGSLLSTTTNNSAFAGNLSVGTTATPNGILDVNGKLVVSSTGFGTTTVTGLNVNGSATTTSNVGFNITTGCYAIGGTCVGGGSGSMAIGGTITSATLGSVLFAGAGGVLAQDNSNFFWDNTGKKFGIGTTTPWAQLSINSVAGLSSFVIGSSTQTFFEVNKFGAVNIAVSSTSAFNVADASGNSFFSVDTSAASTNSGIDITSGASQTGNLFNIWKNDGITNLLAVNYAGYMGIGTGTPQWLLNLSTSTAPQLALSAGANFGQVTFRNDGTNFYISSTTVAGTATTSISALEIALGGFGTTTIRGLNISGFATSTSNVGFNITTGCYAIGGTCLSAGGGGVTSVTAGNSTLTISPTTGAVLAELNLANANIWSALQTFNYSSSTIYSSFVTASSTNLFAGNLTLSTTTTGCLNTSATGIVYSSTCGVMAIGGLITSATPGSVLFAGPAGVLAQNNANFFWKDTGGMLGIGTTTPMYSLNIATTTRPQLALSGGPTDDVWTFRSIGSSFYLSTSSPLTFATSSTPTLSIIPGGISGRIGISTSSPWGKFSIEMGPLDPAFVVSDQGTAQPAFSVGGSTNGGKVGIGTSSPSQKFSLVGDMFLNTSNIWLGTTTSARGSTTTIFAVATTSLIINSNAQQAFTIGTTTSGGANGQGQQPIFNIATNGATSSIGFFMSTTTGLYANVGTPMIKGNHVWFGNGISTTTIMVPRGDICVDADGYCIAVATTSPAGGTVTARRFITSNSDVAEMYASTEALEPGDVVAITSPVHNIRIANAGDVNKTLGIISTQPGLTLGSSDLDKNDGVKYPVALVGRIPTKVSTENGEIKTGDYLVLSSTSGVAMKAKKAGQTLGQALEDYNGVGVGKISVFVKNSYFEGQTPSELGVTATGTEISSSDILSYFVGHASTTAVNFSHLFTDSIFAEKEIVTPTITAADIFTNKINSTVSVISPLMVTDLLNAKNIEGLTTLSVNGGVTITGGLTVDSIGSANIPLSILSDTTFFGRPYFTSDTAGSAVVVKGDRKVDIVFDRDYISIPIVNATISLNGASTTVALEESILQGDMRFIVSRKTTHGFTIVLNKDAVEDLNFSWTAFAVKDAKPFNSQGSNQSASDKTSPIITINGNNPAQITKGTSYIDLGASVVDTNADGTINNNLGLHFTVDGVSLNDVTIDTSTTTTHTIVYSAVDASNNWGYATRTVEIIAQ